MRHVFNHIHEQNMQKCDQCRIGSLLFFWDTIEATPPPYIKIDPDDVLTALSP